MCICVCNSCKAMMWHPITGFEWRSIFPNYHNYHNRFCVLFTGLYDKSVSVWYG